MARATDPNNTKLPPIAPGQRYGRLTAVAFVERGKHYSARWRFLCDCGQETVIEASAARKGNTKSCGCFKSEMSVKNGQSNITHGLSQTKEYDVWQKMHDRCCNPASKDYANYGGRGISVCERWSTFEHFYADMNCPRPSSRHSLDRYPDKNGNYEPGNVRWATPKQQARNQRKTIFITYDGRDIPLIEAAELFGIRYLTLKYRIQHGWSVNRALNLEH
jgi:hypothetical protein